MQITTKIRRQQSRRVTVPHSINRMRGDRVTVCIAALCRWNYSSGDKPDDWGVVAITASDRMITFGDVQYEPNQTKVANFSRNVMLLISGDYALHSEAIKTTMKDLAGRQNVLPRDVALMYGRAMQAIKRRHAEDIYLAPIGLNTDTLFAQQKEMSDSLTSALINQLQDCSEGRQFVDLLCS